LGVRLTTLPCKKKIVEKPPRNSAGFCGGGQGLSWAVEPRKERKVGDQSFGGEYLDLRGEKWRGGGLEKTA
jgi:hypothetical protein